MLNYMFSLFIVISVFFSVASAQDNDVCPMDLVPCKDAYNVVEVGVLGHVGPDYINQKEMIDYFLSKQDEISRVTEEQLAYILFKLTREIENDQCVVVGQVLITVKAKPLFDTHQDADFDAVDRSLKTWAKHACNKGISVYKVKTAFLLD